MRGKSFFALVFSILVSLILTAHAGAILIAQAPNGPYTGTALVPGFGEFSFDQQGRLDLLGELKNRQAVIGEAMKIPGKFTVVLMPTRTTNCEKFTVLLEELSGTKVLELKSIKESIPDYAVRTFYGPAIITTNLRSLDKKLLVLAINTANINEIGSRGIIYANFYIPKNQTTLELVIYLPGYEVKLVDVLIPPYVSPDNPGVIPLAKSDFVLEPAKYQVIRLEPTNYYNPLEMNKVVLTHYYLKQWDRYKLVVKANDGNEQAQIGGLTDLKEGMASASIVLNLVSNQSEINDLTSSWQPVKQDELPLTIPRVEVATGRMTYKGPVNAAEIKSQFDDGKQKTDPQLARIAYFIVGLSLIVGFVLGFYQLKRKRDREKAKKERDFQSILEELSSGSYATWRHATEILYNKSLDSATRLIIHDAMDKILLLIADVHKKETETTKLNNEIDRHRDFQKKNLPFVKISKERQSFDLAMSYMTLIKDSEKQLKIITDASDTLAQVIKLRMETVRQLLVILEDLTARAQFSIMHSMAIENLTGIQEKIIQTMKEVKESFDTESLTELSAAKLQGLAEERKKARNVGVSANDVAALEDFLKNHG